MEIYLLLGLAVLAFAGGAAAASSSAVSKAAGAAADLAETVVDGVDAIESAPEAITGAIKEHAERQADPGPTSWPDAWARLKSEYVDNPLRIYDVTEDDKRIWATMARAEAHKIDSGEPTLLSYHNALLCVSFAKRLGFI